MPIQKEGARILLVEDDHEQGEIIESILVQANYHVHYVDSAEDAMLAIKESSTSHAIDVIFCDWKLGSFTGMEVLKFARNQIPEVGFAIATAYGTIAHAVEAIAAGADDYLAKPFQRQSLLLCIEKAYKAKQLRQQNTQLHERLFEQNKIVNLVGNAPCMQKVYSRIERVSVTSATVLISGESGTGKELAARALHELSPRKENPFIAVNCGAIVETLAEAELFGAKKGSYTGAIKDTVGKLQSAHKGTLFLDEIGELSPNIQTKLLRFLQENTITAVGDANEIPIDVRVIAATNRSLSTMVEQGTFREDLFYRLNIVPIDMPPLRDRRQDIPALIEFFTDKFEKRYHSKLPKLKKTTLKAMLDYYWPGNVRELSNKIERLALLSEEDDLLQDLQPPPLAAKFENHEFTLPEEGLDWNKFEQSCLQQALNRFNNNRTLAAKFLGMSYKTFVYRLNKFGIE